MLSTRSEVRRCGRESGPHQISVSYVDKQGRALGRPLPVTRAPSPDPTVDVWPGGAVGSKALGVIAWEEVVDGLEVLVAQGAASLERWTGRTVPDQAMREAVKDIAT